MRELATAHGPFVSVHLPPGTDLSVWRTLRNSLTVEGFDDHAGAAAALVTLHRVLTSTGVGPAGRALIASGGRLLVDEPPAWSPPAPFARVSDLPYLLPLAQRYPVRAMVGAGGSDPDRTVFDQFVFESSRPEGLAVDGLERCAAMLSAGNADALVVRVDQLGDRTVWVGGTHRAEVAADNVTLRAAGLPPNPQRADEALPMAALTVGAEIFVTDELPLTDGVGVLLRHP
jgi:hypothetical protein